MEIKRDLYLSKLIARRFNSAIKIISGIRRCGKSYLLFKLYYDYLLSIGIKKDYIITIELDDNKYEELRKMHDEGIYNQLTEKGLECQWCSKNSYGNLEYLIGNDSRAIDLKMYLKTREVKR